MTSSSPSQDLRITIFADGGDIGAIAAMAAHPRVAGFTTNATLMRKTGVDDYRAFARDVLAVAGERPVSFAVVADSFAAMEREAHELASWGENVYAKIPVTNAEGRPAVDLVRRLSAAGIRLNVTAMLTVEQVRAVSSVLADAPALLSFFAGRIADTGRDPVPAVTEALATIRARPSQRLVWASPREVFNLFQADAAGCHVITVTRELLDKLPMAGMDLDALSLDTVRMFLRDARGYQVLDGDPDDDLRPRGARPSATTGG